MKATRLKELQVTVAIIRCERWMWFIQYLKFGLSMLHADNVEQGILGPRKDNSPKQTQNELDRERNTRTHKIIVRKNENTR